MWRVGLRWYLVVLIGPPVIILLVTIVLPDALASFQTLAPLDPLLLLVSFPLVLTSEDHCLRKEGGAVSRCPVCSGYMVLLSGASSSGYSGSPGSVAGCYVSIGAWFGLH